MDYDRAQAYVLQLKADPTGQKPGWKNRRHFATTLWRGSVGPKLSRDSYLKDETALSLCEIVTTVEIPGIDLLTGIIAVDELGLWYTTNKREDLAEPAERHGLIPWHLVQTMILHRAD